MSIVEINSVLAYTDNFACINLISSVEDKDVYHFNDLF